MFRWSYPLAATVLALVFSALVGRQYLGKKKTHQLLWSISFAIFAFATFSEFISEFTQVWNVTLYRFYYVASASLVGLMGAGTVFLLSNKRGARIFLVLMLLVIAALSYGALTAAVNEAAFVPGVTVAGKAMPRAVRIFSPLINVPGSLALIGGALYSWYRTRTGYNLLIALGALVIAAAGSAARFGRTEFLYAGEIVGLAFLFLGFLRSREVPRERLRAIPAASARSRR